MEQYDRNSDLCQTEIPWKTAVAVAAHTPAPTSLDEPTQRPRSSFPGCRMRAAKPQPPHGHIRALDKVRTAQSAALLAPNVSACRFAILLLWFHLQTCYDLVYENEWLKMAQRTVALIDWFVTIYTLRKDVMVQRDASC